MTPKPQDENTPAPVEHDLSPLVLLRRLDKQDAMLEQLLKDQQEAKDSKSAERFIILEHDFKVMKRLAWVMLGGFALAVLNGILSHMSLRLTDAPTAESTAARTFIDRIDKPEPVPPQPQSPAPK